MTIIQTINRKVVQPVKAFINREFVHNPGGWEGAAETTALRVIAGFAYLAFAALILWLMALVITFFLANFGVIVETIFVLVVSYFVGMLVRRRVRDITREKEES